MPDISASSVNDAWNALWTPNGVYHLPSKLKKKTRQGPAWFRPVPPIPIQDSGPIVVLNRDPWGIVTVNLKNGLVSQLETIHPEGFTYDPATGAISARVSFKELKFVGDYEVRRGRATSSAIKIASKALQPHPSLAPAAAAATGGTDGITLAKNYQNQLSHSAGQSGQVMLNTYYTHNDAYASAFQNTKLLKNWQFLQTGGKTTSDFAAQTTNAAQPGNTQSVNVNGDPSYSPHAFTMQLLVATACNAQGNTKAATLTPSGTPQTVNNVMTTVATTPPPSQDSLVAMAVVPEPDWMIEIRKKVQPIIEEIEKEEEDVRRGVILREETARPVHSGFRSYVPSPPITITGAVAQAEDGSPVVNFTGIDGVVSEVNLALGVFPGRLHPHLAEAVGKANFLKAILARRITSSIATSALLPHMGRLMTLALSEKLGPVS
jgi:hypothetical protein